MSKSINNICHNEKRKRTGFNFIFCPNTKIIQRGLSSCSWFSLDYVTFSCNVSTSKRSRWVEEMQCELPWADGELMKPWCKCYVASQPIFYTTTVQQSWKNTLEGNITSTKSFDCLHISISSSPRRLLSSSASTSANHPYQHSSSLMYLNSLILPICLLRLG